MSTLHAELVAEGPPTACRICAFISTLSPVEAADWANELRLPVSVVSNVAVVRALRKRGINLAETSVRRHRSNHRG